MKVARASAPPYVAGVLEKPKRIFNERHIPCSFQTWQHCEAEVGPPEGQPPPRQKQSNVVCAVQSSEECTDLDTGERKQHRRANSSGQESAVHLPLKDRAQSFKDASVKVLAREDGGG